jgi:hypothetical protein
MMPWLQSPWIKYECNTCDAIAFLKKIYISSMFYAMHLSNVRVYVLFSVPISHTTLSSHITKYRLFVVVSSIHIYAYILTK